MKILKAALVGDTHECEGSVSVRSGAGSETIWMPVCFPPRCSHRSAKWPKIHIVLSRRLHMGRIAPLGLACKCQLTIV